MCAYVCVLVSVGLRACVCVGVCNCVCVRAQGVCESWPLQTVLAPEKRPWCISCFSLKSGSYGRKPLQLPLLVEDIRRETTGCFQFQLARSHRLMRMQ